MRPQVDPVPTVPGARPEWLHYGPTLPAQVLVWTGAKEALGIPCVVGSTPRVIGELIATSNTSMVQCGHCKRTKVFQDAVSASYAAF